MVWPAHRSDRCEGKYFCRQCRITGDAIGFAIDVLRLDYVAAVKKVTGIALPCRRRKPPAKSGPVWKEVEIDPASIQAELFPLTAEHSAYLAQRGIPRHVAEHFELGSSKTGHAISIPIRIEGRLVGVKYKAWPQQEGPRFYAAPGSYGGMHVFDGLGAGPGIWVVESELDAIMLSQHVSCVLALRSVANPFDQIAKAALKANSPIISCPDNDDAGWEWNVVFILYCTHKLKRSPVTCRVPKEYKDIGHLITDGGNLEEFVTIAYKKAATCV